MDSTFIFIVVSLFYFVSCKTGHPLSTSTPMKPGILGSVESPNLSFEAISNTRYVVPSWFWFYATFVCVTLLFITIIMCPWMTISLSQRSVKSDFQDEFLYFSLHFTFWDFHHFNNIFITISVIATLEWNWCDWDFRTYSEQ